MKTVEKSSKKVLPNTREERRLAVIQKITADKKSAVNFFMKAGIVNKKGTLTERYK